jgi:hypothetical protein
MVPRFLPRRHPTNCFCVKNDLWMLSIATDAFAGAEGMLLGIDFFRKRITRAASS